MTLAVVGVGPSAGRSSSGPAFQMRVMAHSLNMTSSGRDLGVEFAGASRPTCTPMLGRCDAVSMHVAANPQSARMCDKSFLPR